ncbi:MAG: 23S rRNA (uracil(1939)-C(5))-methyltransferase RlmD [Pseudomonadota bacterium]|nr:23S rRNA (uracil(1939)-C(5))-methyltransferase RlmD [Pseudomonadota bacterium]
MRNPATVSIDSFGPEGSGSGLDTAGKRWSVRAAAPGSVVAVGGKPKAGILLEVLTPAEGAVAPRCAQFGVCGGCQWQHMSLEQQHAEKHAALTRLFEPLGGVDHGLVGADPYGYRNKVELSFGRLRYMSKAELDTGISREGRFLGMHAPGRFDKVVDAPRCEIISEDMNAVLARVRADTLASPWALRDPVAHVGFWRHVGLREGRNGVLVLLFTASGDDEQAAWLAAHAPAWGAAGVLWYENDLPADAAVGTLRAVLCGQDHVVERLGGLTYRLSPTAFFQVNPAGAELLCATVALAAGSGTTLVDLYCGTGALGLACAKSFDRVVGIDVNATSIADAQANALANGVDATFLAGEVEKRVAELQVHCAAMGTHPVVIIDPPRVGLHPAALAFVAGLDAKALVYVACKPSSLLRDGLALMAAGWTCTDRWVVDLFPQTGHVEVVSRWERA